MALGSSRPYLIKALFDWIVIGGEDPYVVVAYFYPGVEAPDSHVKDGQIVLTLAPKALTDFSMAELGLVFHTRFGGIPTKIILPYGSITAIYGKESGLGMAFGQEPGGVPELQLHSPDPHLKSNDEVSRKNDLIRHKRPLLRIVKPDD